MAFPRPGTEEAPSQAHDAIGQRRWTAIRLRHGTLPYEPYTWKIVVVNARLRAWWYLLSFPVGLYFCRGKLLWTEPMHLLHLGFDRRLMSVRSLTLLSACQGSPRKSPRTRLARALQCTTLIPLRVGSRPNWPFCSRSAAMRLSNAYRVSLVRRKWKNQCSRPRNRVPVHFGTPGPLSFEVARWIYSTKTRRRGECLILWRKQTSLHNGAEARRGCGSLTRTSATRITVVRVER